MDEPGGPAPALARDDRLMGLRGIGLTDASPTAWVLELPVPGEHLAFSSSCDGAVVYALAECAFALPSNSHGALATGIETHMAYSPPARRGARLRARAAETARSGRRAAHQLRAEATDWLRVPFTGTACVTARAHPGGALGR